MQEQVIKEKIDDQNSKLKNCNKIINETIKIGNNTNEELQRQDGIY